MGTAIAPYCKVMNGEVMLDVCRNGRVHNKADSFSDLYTANEEYMNGKNDRHKVEGHDGVREFFEDHCVRI
jgi:hypothetical protein